MSTVNKYGFALEAIFRAFEEGEKDTPFEVTTERFEDLWEYSGDIEFFVEDVKSAIEQYLAGERLPESEWGDELKEQFRLYVGAGATVDSIKHDEDGNLISFCVTPKMSAEDRESAKQIDVNQKVRTISLDDARASATKLTREQNLRRGRRKATEEDVRNIRLLAHEGLSISAIAETYNLHRITIRNIVNRTAWQDVA